MWFCFIYFRAWQCNGEYISKRSRRKLHGGSWICLLHNSHNWNLIKANRLRILLDFYMNQKQTLRELLLSIVILFWFPQFWCEQVLGNAKGAVAVVISILLFRNPVTFIGIAGYTMTVLGVAAYGEAKRRYRWIIFCIF